MKVVVATLKEFHDRFIDPEFSAANNDFSLITVWDVKRACRVLCKTPLTRRGLGRPIELERLDLSEPFFEHWILEDLDPNDPGRARLIGQMTVAFTICQVRQGYGALHEEERFWKLASDLLGKVHDVYNLGITRARDIALQSLPHYLLGTNYFFIDLAKDRGQAITELCYDALMALARKTHSDNGMSAEATPGFAASLFQAMDEGKWLLARTIASDKAKPWKVSERTLPKNHCFPTFSVQFLWMLI
jgi:hypothetical protein